MSKILMANLKKGMQRMIVHEANGDTCIVHLQDSESLTATGGQAGKINYTKCWMILNASLRDLDYFVQ